MPVHVIVGASRGLGYGILKYFAQDPANTVIGIVRNPGPTQAQLEKDGLSDKTTLLTGDLTNYASLVACAEKISQLANGAIDYLWNNGAYLNEKTSEVFFTEWNDSNYSDFLAELRHGYETNVIGVINSINAFLPLVLKSSIKKVITISSGHGDVNLIRDFGVWEAPAYSVEKAALNAVVAKYDARYRGDGVLFLSLSPGVVDTGHACELSLYLCSFLPTLPRPHMRASSNCC